MTRPSAGHGFCRRYCRILKQPERLEAPGEVEKQIVVRLPAPDLLDPAVGPGAEDQDGERPERAKLVAEVFGHRPERREPGVRVVQAGALLLPPAAQGVELVVLARCHWGKVSTKGMTIE